MLHFFKTFWGFSLEMNMLVFNYFVIIIKKLLWCFVVAKPSSYLFMLSSKIIIINLKYDVYWELYLF